MKPIRQNDYYSLFQTGLLIALEELGVKQAHVANVCDISPGYLSKLKGWNKHQESESLLARPHVTNTNFKRYAVPLMQFLDQEHRIRFADGFFVDAADTDTPRQWGEITPVRLPERVVKTPIDSSAPNILEGIPIPQNGNLSIEVNIDLSDRENLEDILNTLQYLSTKPNVHLQVKLTLFDNRETPPKQRSQRFSQPAESAPEDYLLNFYRRKFLLNRNLDLEVERGGNGFSKFIATTDARSGAQREQFCDYSAWEALQRQGDWNYSPETRIIHGGGTHQYLLSRYSYGAYPFNLQAVLRFDGYAQHAGAATETANAGLILGWQSMGRGHKNFHLLLDGQTMRLELVGAETGNHYADFKPIDAGAPFVIDDDAEYQFMMRVSPEKIAVFVDNVLRYETATPPGMEGQVGIRPWRAQVTYSYFETVI